LGRLARGLKRPRGACLRVVISTGGLAERSYRRSQDAVVFFVVWDAIAIVVIV